MRPGIEPSSPRLLANTVLHKQPKSKIDSYRFPFNRSPLLSLPQSLSLSLSLPLSLLFSVFCWGFFVLDYCLRFSFHPKGLVWSLLKIVTICRIRCIDLSVCLTQLFRSGFISLVQRQKLMSNFFRFISAAKQDQIIYWLKKENFDLICKLISLF